jgi:hypothetical protein
MIVHHNLGSTSSSSSRSSSKNDGFWDDAWGAVKDVGKGAIRGGAQAAADKLAGKKKGGGAPPPQEVYLPPPPPAEPPFHKTTLGKIAIGLAAAKLLKVF